MGITHSQPASLNDLIFPDSATEKRIRQYANNQRHGNIILHGPPGTGKSTAAYIIANTRAALTGAGPAYTAPVYNGAQSLEFLIEELLREWNFCSLQGARVPCVVIDEVDKLSIAQQDKLRAQLDRGFSGHVILTTNHIYRLDAALRDRCDCIEMPTINSDHWRSKFEQWLAAYNIKLTEQSLDAVLSTCNGTIRDLKRAADDIICAKS